MIRQDGRPIPWPVGAVGVAMAVVAPHLLYWLVVREVAGNFWWTWPGVLTFGPLLLAVPILRNSKRPTFAGVLGGAAGLPVGVFLDILAPMTVAMRLIAAGCAVLGIVGGIMGGRTRNLEEYVEQQVARSVRNAHRKD